MILLLNSCNSQSQSDPHYNLNFDQIVNEEQAEALVRFVNKDYSNFKIYQKERYANEICSNLFDSPQVKPFVITDLDNNGYSDLLVMGELDYIDLTTIGNVRYLNNGNPFCIIYILNFGNDSISTAILPAMGKEICSFPIVNKSTQNITFIDYYYENINQISKKEVSGLSHKKLIFKFGGFIEYNDSPKDFHIQKIEFETTPCLGNCPDFSFTIYSDRKVEYNAQAFNYVNGKFEMVMDKDSYSDLTALLNYINFPYLEDKYSPKINDDQGCLLTITYNNGKVKNIQDYALGRNDVFGLLRLYQLFFDLRHNQSWKERVD
jgi:hypothetical protein